MEKSQREYYLNEQMKAIQKELGEMDDAPDENEALKRKIDAARMPKEAKEKAEAELQKLKMMSASFSGICAAMVSARRAGSSMLFSDVSTSGGIFLFSLM